MIEALVDLGFDPDLFTAVRVKPTYWNNFSATFREFSDGSAAIAVASSLGTLVNTYASFVAVPMSHIADHGFLHGLWRSRQAVQRGSLLDNPWPLSGFLRYTFVNLRVYGLTATLALRTSKDATDTATLITVYATRFIIGHELAHRALGHRGSHHGFEPTDQPPARTTMQQQESEADLLAFRALTRSIETDFANHQRHRAQAASLASLGVLTALVAVYADERAVFLRQGNSHPPVSARIEQLLRQLNKSDQEYARMFAVPLSRATEAAATFEPTAVTFNWRNLREIAPNITTPQPDTYLQQIEMLDRLLSLSESKLIAFLTGPDIKPLVGDGIQLLQEGKADAALHRWGVPSREAGLICDPSIPLAFSTLVAALREGFKAVDLPPVQHLGNAVAAAALAAPLLARLQ